MRDSGALLALCNEYLASWTPRESARLPEDCRPVTLHSVDDLDRWLHRLSERLCDATFESRDEAVTDLLAFLFSAHDRAREMHPSPASANDSALAACPVNHPATS